MLQQQQLGKFAGWIYSVSIGYDALAADWPATQRCFGRPPAPGAGAAGKGLDEIVEYHAQQRY